MKTAGSSSLWKFSCCTTSYFSTVKSLICSATFVKKKQVSFKAFSLVKTEANDSTDNVQLRRLIERFSAGRLPPKLLPISVGFPLRKILTLAHQIKLCVHSFFLYYRFVPKCNRAQQSLICQFLRFPFFFSALFAAPWFVEIQKFLYHGNVTQ